VSTIGLRNVNIAGAEGGTIIRNIILSVTGTKNPRGDNRTFQYNDNNTEFGGANNILYSAQGHMLLSGSSLILHSGKYKIEAPPVADDAFLIKDTGNRDLFRVDTKNKKILFTSFSDTEYYIGVGTDDPQEKFHVDKGNARFENNVIVGDDILPVTDSSSYLGSATKKFKNIYGNLEFKYIQDGISFIETSIPTGTSSYWVDFGLGAPGLSYTPKVVSSMVTPKHIGNYLNEDAPYQPIYFSNIGSVSTSGYFVTFSDVIRNTGYMLNTYVSAKEY
jgi:hypothetical protein